MTYMGHDYYPQWLDNLADDVTLEAAAMDGTAHGAADVRSIVVTAKQLYENQPSSAMPAPVVTTVSWSCTPLTSAAYSPVSSSW